MKKEFQQLEKDIEKLGLSTKEAKVYIALLDLGRGNVTKIASRAVINRTTTYDILSGLTEKGLVMVSGYEPKQEFEALPPERVIDYLFNEQQKIEEKKKSARDIVPRLAAMFNKSDRPKVVFYEGTGGLEKAYEDTLTSTEPIRAFATVDDMHRALPHYFPDYYKRRAGNGIFIRAIVPDTPIGRDRAAKDEDEMRMTALVPADKYLFSPEINIYDDKVMIASWREKIGIIIESKEISDAMKKIYELAWERSRQLDAEIKKAPPIEKPKKKISTK